MPNIVAHNHVAHEVTNYRVRPDEALGSTLSDFAGMYCDLGGDPVIIVGKNDDLDRGIAIQREADKIFGIQPETEDITAGLAIRLEATGIKPRAAKLSAHLLVDLMLDGALLRQDEPRQTFGTLSEYVLDEETTLDAGVFPPFFRRMIVRYFNEEMPEYYNDPEELAELTQERLSGRARTALAKRKNTITDKQVPHVAEAISDHTERIHHLGQIALDRTIAEIKFSGYYS